jgi:phage terminase large subunit
MTKQNPNFDYLESNVPNHRWTLLQGGTRSGKTYSILQWIIKFCYTYKNNDFEIDIVRDTFTALKATIWKDMQTLLVELGIYSDNHHNKTDHIYRLFGNNLNYYGADSPEKIHGRSRDILILNEAQHFEQETIDQLTPRTRWRIIADYNPALGSEHWIDKYIDDYPPIITTYRDNPFLTNEQVLDIESRKDNPYWWSIYGSGQRAMREGVIFPSHRIGEFDTSLPVIYGQDYGYSNDPTTLVKIAVDNKRKIIYCDELLYRTGLNTDEIAKINQYFCGKSLIVGDSSEDRLISELRTKHKLNIQSAIKGPNSVNQGIALMQNYEIVFTAQSKNIKKELSMYIWLDKKSATPIDKHNHLIDAIRYAFMYQHINASGNTLVGGAKRIY